MDLRGKVVQRTKAKSFIHLGPPAVLVEEAIRNRDFDPRCN